MEKVSYSRADVGFAAVHIVGSNNSLVPWNGNTGPTPEQLAEAEHRTAANLRLIDETFDRATKKKQRAVVLLMQADMFDPTVSHPQFTDFSGFQPIVRKIAKRSAIFGKPTTLSAVRAVPTPTATNTAAAVSPSSGAASDMDDVEAPY